MKELYLITRLPVSFRLLEVCNFLEIHNKKANNELGNELAIIFKMPFEKRMGGLADLVMVYLSIAEENNVQLNPSNVQEGLLYIYNYIEKFMGQSIPRGRVSCLQTIGLIHPSTIAMDFIAEDTEDFSTWLPISSP